MGALCGKAAHESPADGDGDRRGRGGRGNNGRGASSAYTCALSTWDENFPPISRAELIRQRQEFWDTRVQGQQEMWQALRAASECGDSGTATVIMESAGLTPYDADSNSHCFSYDNRGFRYEVPFFVLLDPRSVIDTPPAATQTAAATTTTTTTTTTIATTAEPTNTSTDPTAAATSSSSTSSALSTSAESAANTAPPPPSQASQQASAAASTSSTSQPTQQQEQPQKPSSTPASTFGSNPNADLHVVVRLSNALGDLKLACMRTDTIGHVRAHLSSKFELPLSSFLFLLHGQRLLDQYALRDCGLGADVVLQCFVRQAAA